MMVSLSLPDDSDDTRDMTRSLPLDGSNCAFEISIATDEGLFDFLALLRIIQKILPLPVKTLNVIVKVPADL